MVFFLFGFFLYLQTLLYCENCNIEDICENIVLFLTPHCAALSPTRLSCTSFPKLRCLQWHQEPLRPDGLQLQHLFISSFIYLFKTNDSRLLERSRCQGFNMFPSWTSFKIRWLIKTWESQLIVIITMMIHSNWCLLVNGRTQIGVNLV